MIRIENDSPRAYSITTVTGEDIMVEWEELPQALLDCGKDNIQSIRIWSPRTKVFKAIGRKRLAAQFKEHELYEQIKGLILTKKS